MRLNEAWQIVDLRVDINSRNFDWNQDMDSVEHIFSLLYVFNRIYIYCTY